MEKCDRHRRALGLRSGQIAAPNAGKKGPLTPAERARIALNHLCRCLPVKKLIVLPRNHAEAHRRADSMCALLGIPFRILGPLLYAAAILVKNKRGGGLGFAQDGFDTLLKLYNRQPSQQLCILRKSLSEKSVARDARKEAEPVTRRFYYIYRGSIVPMLKYVPLVADDLVVFQKSSWTKVEALSEEIFRGLDPAVAVFFMDPTLASSELCRISVETQATAISAPNSITPTEGQLPSVSTAMSPSPSQSTSQLQRPTLFHSPPMRSPGFSPPLRRVRRSDNVNNPRQIILEEQKEEPIVEDVVQGEEEKKDDDADQPAPLLRPSVQEEKEASRQLDFDLRNDIGLRPGRAPSSKAIEVSERRQATPAMRAKIIWLAEQWGYNTAQLQRDKLEIAELASCIVFYDCGFPKAPKGRMLASWVKELEEARYSNNTDFGSALENEQLGSRQGTYCGRIEAVHPGYLHELYRKAGLDTKVTYRATFAELAAAMNEYSRTDHLQRPELHLTRHHLKVWFRANRGKVKKGWERPILTKERMKKRVEWCQNRKAEMAAAAEAGDDCFNRRYYCFLDEKWFYIRSRRKKLKVLPRGPLEAEGADNIPIERESSRRHATKVMILGVIAAPEEEYDFDGKVYFTRVARNRKLARTTCSDKIFDDLAKNTALHRQWHEFVDENQDADEMLELVAAIFDIDDEDMRQRLIIRYKDHQANGVAKWKCFESFESNANQSISPQPNAARRPLRIGDLVLEARYQKDEEIPEDVSCDSTFMREHMDAIGQAIRAKYHWVPEEDEIFLVMDNAGGHGTKDCITEYVEDLLESHKVRMIWQEPRGPELNLLDLGAWMSLQSAVEKHFRGNRNDVEVLARKIAEVWASYDAAVFQKIWKRWKLALDLIIADEGNNRLVNEHRGSLFTAAAPPLQEDNLPAPTDDYDVDPDPDFDDDDDDDII